MQAIFNFLNAQQHLSSSNNNTYSGINIIADTSLTSAACNRDNKNNKRPDKTPTTNQAKPTSHSRHPQAMTLYLPVPTPALSLSPSLCRHTGRGRQHSLQFEELHYRCTSSRQPEERERDAGVAGEGHLYRPSSLVWYITCATARAQVAGIMHAQQQQRERRRTTFVCSKLEQCEQIDAPTAYCRVALWRLQRANQMH